MAFTQVTITQDYTLADGTEPSGSVTFTPTTPMLDAGLVIPQVPAVARLAGGGTITTTLVANTDPGTTPAGSSYKVDELINGIRRSYYIQVPYDQGSSLTLYSLAQIASPPGLSFPPSSGTLNSVTAADASIVVTGTSTDPIIAVGTIDESAVNSLVTDLAAKAARASNLSDLGSASTARTNLGLGGSAVLAVGSSAGTVAAGDDTRITGAAQKASNLSDLGSASTARTNLGLGGAAVLAVGSSAGTVAAGDDTRFASTGAITGQLDLSAYGTTSTGGTALNAAIAALPASGGTIIVPAGTWTINTAVLINKNGVIIRGVSPGSSKLSFNPASVSTAIAMADTTQRYMSIMDLGIDSTTSGSGTAIDASYFVNSQFHRLRIGISTPPNRGIDFNVVGTYYNTVRDCRIAVAGSGSRCLSFDSISNSNWVDNCRLLGDANTTGVYVNAHANTIARVDCETTMAIGVDVAATGNDCTLISPYLEQVDVGVQLASGVEAFTCLGGVIIDSDVNNIVDNGAKDPCFINTRLQYEPYTSFTARSPAFPQSYPIQTGMVQPLDHGLISWSSDPTLQNTSTVLTAGTVYLTKVYVRNAATLSNIYWWVGSAAVTATAGQNEVGVYSSAGTRMASANVDASITSTGLKTTAVTPVSLAAGWYWVAGVFNAGTLPGLMRGNGGAGITTAMNVGLTASFLRYATNATSQTSLPSSITPASNAATAFAGPWMAIG